MEDQAAVICDWRSHFSRLREGAAMSAAHHKHPDRLAVEVSLPLANLYLYTTLRTTACLCDVGMWSAEPRFKRARIEVTIRGTGNLPVRYISVE